MVDAVIRAAAVALAGLVAACGGGGGGDAPVPPVTIADPLAYLTQTSVLAGNVALHAADPWRYVRFDFGRHQIAQSFLRPDDGGVVTIWSYPPFGPFVAANGDGGETYERIGEVVYITATQDGGKPGMQQFGLAWPLFDIRAPECPEWRTIGLSRFCRATVTYPVSGVPGDRITADTIISEHGNERFYMARDWGRLAWQAWGPPGSCSPVSDLPDRSPALSFDGPPAGHPDWIRCDTRVNTNIEGADGTMSGAAFGWPP